MRTRAEGTPTTVRPMRASMTRVIERVKVGDEMGAVGRRNEPPDRSCTVDRLRDPKGDGPLDLIPENE
jgi:hypothetical protein